MPPPCEAPTGNAREMRGGLPAPERGRDGKPSAGTGDERPFTRMPLSRPVYSVPKRVIAKITVAEPSRQHNWRRCVYDPRGWGEPCQPAGPGPREKGGPRGPSYLGNARNRQGLRAVFEP